METLGCKALYGPPASATEWRSHKSQDGTFGFGSTDKQEPLKVLG